MNFCSQCGNQLSKDDKFCPGCGFALANASTNQVNSADAAPTFDYNDGRKHSRISTHTPESGDYQNDATVEFGDLHPAAVLLFFVSYIGKSAILIPLIALGAWFLEPMLWWLFLVYILGHYIAARITYRNYQFEVTPSAFKKQYGIIHKQSSSIPYDRIQNVNVSRNLIDRLLGLAHLEIETAGNSGDSDRNVLGGASSSSEGYIPGISVDEARDLKELVLLRAQNMRGGNTDVSV